MVKPVLKYVLASLQASMYMFQKRSKFRRHLIWQFIPTGKTTKSNCEKEEFLKRPRRYLLETLLVYSPRQITQRIGNLSSELPTLVTVDLLEECPEWMFKYSQEIDVSLFPWRVLISFDLCRVGDIVYLLYIPKSWKFVFSIKKYIMYTFEIAKNPHKNKQKYKLLCRNFMSYRASLDFIFPKKLATIMLYMF